MDICWQPFQGGTEAAARNARAIRLYRRLGYGCLNTITLRKDFILILYKTVWFYKEGTA